MFVLDTDHLGILQRQTAPQFGVLMHRISQYPQTSFFVTIVSFHEQILGWNAYLAQARDSSGVVRGYTKLEGILSDFACSQVLPYTSASAGVFEELRKLGSRATVTARVNPNTRIAIVSRRSEP